MEENKFVKGLTIGCFGFIILIVVVVVLFFNSNTFKNILTDIETYQENRQAQEKEKKEKER